MELTIRGVEERDTEAVHAILTSDHVIAGSMRVPHARLAQTSERLTPRLGLYQLVAEDDGRVVGFAELITQPDEPRHAHNGEINMVAAHGDWLGQGIGRALTEALIELAFDYLRLARISLIVFEGNEAAIALYERLGFSHEGTMPRFGYGAGEWMDARMMGLLR
jgi:putative acetyltransferase